MGGVGIVSNLSPSGSRIWFAEVSMITTLLLQNSTPLRVPKLYSLTDPANQSWNGAIASLVYLLPSYLETFCSRAWSQVQGLRNLSRSPVFG